MRVSNSLWTVGALLSGVSQSSQKAIPDAPLAARQEGIPPPQTVTLPGTVSTVTGAPITQVVTEVVPEKTTTVTEDGYLVISTFPAQSTVKTTVLGVPPYPVPLPGSTTVVTPISQVTLCPKPTGAARNNLKSAKGSLFGCEVGFVCNPPMPDSCNLWPDIPSPDFTCRPEDCIPAPPTVNELRRNAAGEAYYLPAWGYFHLDPRPFGLTYDYFGYASSGNAKRNIYIPRRLKKRQSDNDDTPARCHFWCDETVRLSSGLGQPQICEDENFTDALEACRLCVVDNIPANGTSSDPRDYLNPIFTRWLDQCDGDESETPPSGPPSQVSSSTGTIETTSGSPPTTTGFTPITTSTPTTSPETSTLPPSTTSSTTSTSSSISLNTSSSTTLSTSSSETSSSTALPSFSNSTVTTVTPSAPSFPITPTSTPSTTPIAPPPPSSAVVLLPAGATLLVLLFTTLALLI